ncbi:RRP15-like protein [Gouania willdenowi]|uniref:RRP15-like protein n=1 Tax=Gouania willdenowi TaxID=441366 RepID=UPI0010569DF3|nr:RRP15-like protein [Gouania willdenowi]
MAQEEIHVPLSGEDAAPQIEDDGDGSNSEGGSISNQSEDGSDGEEVGGEDEDGGECNTNAGWAQAMAKILGKKTAENKSCSILVKNKELEKTKARERQEQLEKKQQVNKRQLYESMCREKLDVVKDRDTERALQRIATRGVVQLFNAVRKHQKSVDDKLKEVGGSERKKAKILSSVSKRDFIGYLRGKDAEKPPEAAAEEKPAWSVLTEDFMMGATMKDWDKESEEDGEDEQ